MTVSVGWWDDGGDVPVSVTYSLGAGHRTVHLSVDEARELERRLADVLSQHEGTS